MKKMTYFLFVLLSVLTVSCSNAPKQSKQDTALSVIFNRKSVRSFTAQPITEEEIQTLLKAGFSAPTAKNIQPWEFVVLSSRSAIDSLADYGLTGSKNILHEAQLAIVIVGDTVKSTRWNLDCSAATENILLAAEALDLGGVWLANYPWRDRMERVSNVVGVPSHILPLATVAIGHPKGNFEPINKFKPEKIHLNKW